MFCYKIEEFYLAIMLKLISFVSLKIFNFKTIYYTKNDSNNLQNTKRYFY